MCCNSETVEYFYSGVCCTVEYMCCNSQIIEYTYSDVVCVVTVRQLSILTVTWCVLYS